MTTKDWTIVASTAAIACALTLGVLWPGQLTADEEKQIPEVQLPTLTIDGCTLAMNVTQRQIKTGEKPAVQIIAENPTDSEKTLRAQLHLEGMDFSSRWSRMPMPPSTYWQTPIEIVLKPGQKKTLSYEADTGKLQAFSVNFRLAPTAQAIASENTALEAANMSEAKPAVERQPAVERPNATVAAQVQVNGRFGAFAARPGVTSPSIGFLPAEASEAVTEEAAATPEAAG